MRFPLRAKIVILGFAALAAGTLAYALTMPEPKAPEARFVTLSGESLMTSDFRGKVTVVNFWATTCGICLKEMPKMAERYLRYAPQGYDMVAVAMSQDHPNRVAQLAQRRALPYKVALDTTSEVAQRFGDVRLTPTTYLIDRKGRVVRRFVGKLEWQEFDRLIEKALAEPA